MQIKHRTHVYKKQERSEKISRVMNEEARLKMKQESEINSSKIRNKIERIQNKNFDSKKNKLLIKALLIIIIFIFIIFHIIYLLILLFTPTHFFLCTFRINLQYLSFMFLLLSRLRFLIVPAWLFLYLEEFSYFYYVLR